MNNRSIWHWDSDLRCWVAFVEDIMVLSDTYVQRLDAYDWRVKIVPAAGGTEFRTIVAIERVDDRCLYLTRYIMDAEDGDIIYRRDITGDADGIFDARFINLSRYAWDRPFGYNDPTVIRER